MSMMCLGSQPVRRRHVCCSAVYWGTVGMCCRRRVTRWARPSVVSGYSGSGVAHCLSWSAVALSAGMMCCSSRWRPWRREGARPGHRNRLEDGVLMKLRCRRRGVAVDLYVGDRWSVLWQVQERRRCRSARERASECVSKERVVGGVWRLRLRETSANDPKRLPC